MDCVRIGFMLEKGRTMAKVDRQKADVISIDSPNDRYAVSIQWSRLIGESSQSCNHSDSNIYTHIPIDNKMYVEKSNK